MKQTAVFSGKLFQLTHNYLTRSNSVKKIIFTYRDYIDNNIVDDGTGYRCS